MLGPLIARSLVVAVCAHCMSLLLAQSGHHRRAGPCPLSGVKQTLVGSGHGRPIFAVMHNTVYYA